MKGKLVVLILFSTLIFSCKSNKDIPSADTNTSAGNTSAEKDSLLTAIDRGACFGYCPEYYAVIYKSGYAVYTGRKNAFLKGKNISRLNNDELAQLLALIRDNKIEQLDTAYINPHIADFPGWSIWVSDRGPVKKITVMHDTPPEGLQRYGQRLDELLQSLKWKSAGLEEDE